MAKARTKMARYLDRRRQGITEAAENPEPASPRYKRKDQQIWAWDEKLYVPCPTWVKNRIRVLAIKAGMSQAEFCLMLLADTLSRPQGITKAVKGYRATGLKPATPLSGKEDSP